MWSRTLVLVSLCLVFSALACSGGESEVNVEQVAERACGNYELCASYYFDQSYDTVEECTAYVVDHIEHAYAQYGDACGDAWKAYWTCDGNVGCDVYEVESNCPDEDLLTLNNCSN